MSFFSTLLGKTGKKQAMADMKYRQGQAQQGYDANRGYAQQGYQSATQRLDPYVQSGQQGQAAYQNLLGLGGADAQSAARQAYSGWNPYLTDDITSATRALDRRAAATGQFGSGMNALAKARAATEMGSQDFYGYADRLQGLGQQRLQASGAQAGYDMTNTQNMMGLENQYRNALSGAHSDYSKAYTQADTAGVQNILGLAGTALNAFGGGFGGFGGGNQVYSQAGNASNGGWSTTASTPSWWQQLAKWG